MTRRLSFLLIGLAVAAAGCGGDDALTEEEFLSQGNEICAAGSEQIDSAAEESFGPGEQPSAEDQEAFIAGTVVPATQDQIDELGELEPPEELADQVEGLLGDAQSALDEFAEDPVTEAEEDPFADVNARAAEIGLTECAA